MSEEKFSKFKSLEHSLITKFKNFQRIENLDEVIRFLLEHNILDSNSLFNFSYLNEMYHKILFGKKQFYINILSDKETNLNKILNEISKNEFTLRNFNIPLFYSKSYKTK
ncbi:MAG: hypothetical protein MJ252_25755, partial [archaeon]|nr:hypothetical protein [archaeon]